MRLLKQATVILTAVILSFSMTRFIGQYKAEAVAIVGLHLHSGKVWKLSNSALYQMKYTATSPQVEQTIKSLVRNGALQPVTISEVLKGSQHTLYGKDNPGCQEAITSIHPISPKELGGYCWPEKAQQGVSHTGRGQWFPQSIAVAPNLYGKVLAVGWYKKGTFGSRGTRLSLIHAPKSNGSNLHYANILFASISGTPENFVVSDVKLHTGGFGWYQTNLYMADTNNGNRVFNMNQIYRVSTGENILGIDPLTGNFYAHNYQYIIFQSGRYTRKLQGMEDIHRCSRAPNSIGYRYCFSTLSVDRTSHPASLITAEYRQAAAMREDYNTNEPMRIVRWPLDPETGLLATGSNGLVTSNHAYGTWTERVQGAVSHNGVFYLASSAGDSNGTLYVSGLHGTVRTKDWAVGPEDLSIGRSKDRLWSLTEHAGKRMLFWVKRK